MNQNVWDLLFRKRVAMHSHARGGGELGSNAGARQRHAVVTREGSLLLMVYASMSPRRCDFAVSAVQGITRKFPPSVVPVPASLVWLNPRIRESG